MSRSKLITAIGEVEGLADRLETSRELSVQLDKERQKLRGARRAISSSMDAGDMHCQVAIDGERKQQKKLVGMLAEKGGAPEGCGPGLLNAFLTLEDKD